MNFTNKDRLTYEYFEVRNLKEKKQFVNHDCIRKIRDQETNLELQREKLEKTRTFIAWDCHKFPKYIFVFIMKGLKDTLE